MTDILDASDSSPLTGGPSFSLKNRIIRVLWIVIWALLAAWTPPPFRPWRRFLLRIFGAKVSKTSGIYGSAKIWLPSNLTVGNHSYIGPGVTVYCMAPIHIGDHVTISQGAHLCAGTHDIDDPHFQLVPRPITIHDRVWVAAEAFVGPGVTIATGAVLGARAVAMKNLDTWTVYSGNPATALRRRKSPYAPPHAPTHATG